MDTVFNVIKNVLMKFESDPVIALNVRSTFKSFKLKLVVKNSKTTPSKTEVVGNLKVNVMKKAIIKF